jgi:glycine cleavage system transcriptional repressor
MPKDYIISAVGGNRPGVVAELTKHIYLSGINVENSCMTLLADYFTLMLHISIAQDSELDSLQEKLRSMEEETEISTRILPVPAMQKGAEDKGKPRYALRIRGEDRSGIIYKTSQFLARRGVNILEMDTHVEEDPHSKSSLFRMYTLIEVPHEVNEERFRNDLETLAHEMQESITLTKAPSAG